MVFFELLCITANQIVRDSKKEKGKLKEGTWHISKICLVIYFLETVILMFLLEVFLGKDEGFFLKINCN